MTARGELFIAATPKARSRKALLHWIRDGYRSPLFAKVCCGGQSRVGKDHAQPKGVQRHPEQIAGGSMSSISIRQRVEAQFRKSPGRHDGNGVQSDYEAAADALSAKTARLKELRLARDAAALAAPPPPKKTGKSKKPNKRTKRKKLAGVSLLDWMKSRQIGGL
jgi:hypothetical protein